MFFPAPLLEIVVRGTRRRSRPKSAILNRFWVPAGSKMAPWSAIFGQKGAKIKGYLANGTKRPGADLGAIWRRKRSKDPFLTIWGRFWSILEGFWKESGPFWIDF